MDSSRGYADSGRAGAPRASRGDFDSNPFVERDENKRLRTMVPNSAAVLSASLLLHLLTYLCCVSLLTESCSSSICFFFIVHGLLGASLLQCQKAEKHRTSVTTDTAEGGATVVVKSPVAAEVQVGAVIPMNIIAMVADPAITTTTKASKTEGETKTDPMATATETDGKSSVPSRNGPGLLPLIPMALCTSLIPDLDSFMRQKAISSSIQNHATTTPSQKRHTLNTVRSRNFHFVKCPHMERWTRPWRVATNRPVFLRSNSEMRAKVTSAR
mmetsp:Transcript_890/g.2503  ORF Transcript_890/g.2503 Transcript_890/m.2503 type:complete len:271 (-) Transcript_890:1125-1937(-)